MKLKDKKRIITFISIMLIVLNIFVTCFYGFEIQRIILLLLSILAVIYAKRSNNLYPLASIFGLIGIMESHPGMLIISGCGMFSSYMKSDEEKSLKDYIKKNHLISSVIIGISGISLVSYSALISYCTQYKYGSEMISELVACLCLGVIIFICHKYKFIIKNEVTFFEMIKITLPVWLFFLISFTVQIGMNIYTHQLQSSAYIIILFLTYLLVGLFEEFLLRGIVLNILLDKYNNSKKNIWFAVVFSSLLFGVAHFMNLSTGASFFGVLMQVISATAMGIYLAAIYVRTGNIWYNALIHGLWDICASLSFIFIGNEMDYGEIISGYNIITLIPAVFYLMFSLFLLRKKKINGVIAKLNNKEYKEETKSGVLAFQHFASCLVIIFVGFMIMGLIYDFRIINNNVYSTIDKFPMYYDSDKKYLFTDDFANKDLTLELKLYMAVYTLDIDKSKDFTFNDEDLSKAYKKLFKDELKEDEFIDFSYSRNQMCKHKDKGYDCIYDTSTDGKNIKVYTGIKNYTTDGSEVIIELYYLIEDNDTHKIYADSSLNNLLYSGDIDSLTKVKYNEKDYYNTKFFKDISKNIDVPIYKLKFNTNSLDGLAFKDISINTKILNISIKYDDKLFKKKEYNNRIILENNSNYIEIKAISQSLYMDKLINSSIVYFGNNKYYYNSYDEEYLINNNNSYYSVRINITDNSLFDKAYEVLKNLDITEK